MKLCPTCLIPSKYTFIDEMLPNAMKISASFDTAWTTVLKVQKSLGFSIKLSLSFPF